jgi:hypothetical protein
MVVAGTEDEDVVAGEKGVWRSSALSERFAEGKSEMQAEVIVEQPHQILDVLLGVGDPVRSVVFFPCAIYITSEVHRGIRVRSDARRPCVKRGDEIGSVHAPKALRVVVTICHGALVCSGKPLNVAESHVNVFALEILHFVALLVQSKTGVV